MWVVPAETVTNRTFVDEAPGRGSRRVSAGTTHSAANAATYLTEAFLKPLFVTQFPVEMLAKPMRQRQQG